MQQNCCPRGHRWESGELVCPVCGAAPVGNVTDLATVCPIRIEGEAIARLSHPNIVAVYEVGEHDCLPFFSLEFCGGGSLEKRLRGTPLPPRDAAELVRTLAQAMEAAHRAGVVHRDLKPGNVLLSSGDVAASWQLADSSTRAKISSTAATPAAEGRGQATVLECSPQARNRGSGSNAPPRAAFAGNPNQSRSTAA
jgi:serine/threonine protein kinase